MTEGRLVQDFIKSQQKTAREMFEEAGWKCTEDYDVDCGLTHIFCQKEDDCICFRLFSETISTQWFNEPMEIDTETLKLIIAQCKELGWL